MKNRFVHRPVLAVVMAVLLLMLGIVGIFNLPVTLFPPVAPPEVNVTVEYTGANAETVTKAAIVPLERAINGVPGMKYMSSDAGNDGVGVVQVLFETGTNPDVAAINVQNRVNAVMGELPAEVIRNGVKIAKEENAMLMYLNIYSTDTSLQEKFLYNFADIQVLAELKRIKGVGYADILGAREYAMRVWLKPDKMLAYEVSADEVIEALEEQNLEAAPGKLGESSDKTAQVLQYTLKYKGKFNQPEEYRSIPIRAESDGRILTIGDVAEVEFSTTYFDVETRLNGKPSAAIMLKQLPGSNASEVIAQVKERMETLKKSVFLPGMDYEVSYDVSRFLDAALHEVFKTLIEAFILVALVVFVFLQDWKSTLIPALTVPISLIGTFFFIQFLGFSINLITLFALVLAIGIVIDDAIVVVEAVHGKMEQGFAGGSVATDRAMRDIGQAIIAITLVMAAVFVPTAFLGGPGGIFYKQFSITIAIAIALSGFSALTLTPALCAVFMRSVAHAPSKGLFAKFNKRYAALEEDYRAFQEKKAHRKSWLAALFLVILTGIALLVNYLPKGFIPNEDQGTFYASITTPAGATLERTKAVVNAVGKIAEGHPAVESVSTLSGTNVLSDGTGASYGTCLINLKPWDERAESVDDLMEYMEDSTQHLQDASIEFFPPPAVPGYGNASGFELRLLDKTGSGDIKAMDATVNKFIDALRKAPGVASAFTIFNASYPQYRLVLDPAKAALKGVTASNALNSLQTLIGSNYATNFIRFGQMYKVMVQASPEYRAKPEDLLKLYVKNNRGEMVPLSAFMEIEKDFGVDQLTRYNMFPSAEINGEGLAGISSGQLIETVQKTAEMVLPQGYAIDWAGISRDEVNAGNEAIWIFLICLFFVYLILAGQYESFFLPIPVLLSMPGGLLGAYGLLALMGLENNIYTQIALIMLIGLLGKNAILIVEVAQQLRKGGSTPYQAVVEGARRRLRPILMTSIAFIAGLLPLLFGDGAGAIGNATIGAAAAGGMLLGTGIGVMIVPALYLASTSLETKTKKAFNALFQSNHEK